MRTPKPAMSGPLKTINKAISTPFVNQGDLVFVNLSASDGLLLASDGQLQTTGS